MADLYLRKIGLVVSGGGQGTDLSQLHIKFAVQQKDIQTPNTAVIRVYNLADATAQTIQKEYSHVTLQAGYQSGPYGVIFDGTIKQVRRGRENATDTYLDILAADGDEGLNFAVTNTSLAAGATCSDQLDAHLAALGKFDVSKGYVGDLPKEALPRGKVLYGMAADGLRDLVTGYGFSYSIQNGKLTVIPLQGFIPGQAVVLTSKTGMLGLPEQTEDGIKVQCLLNPLLGIGSKLQIDQKSIQQAQQDLAYTAFPVDQNVPGIDKNDGVYRIYVINHQGDIRGNDWLSDIICLSIDPTVTQGLTPGLLAKGQR